MALLAARFMRQPVARLAPKGKVGIFLGAWHTQPIIRREMREISQTELDSQIDRNLRFERMLTDEGTLLIKLWFYLSKERQRERLKGLEKIREPAGA